VVDRCIVDECDRHIRPYGGRGMCSMHLQRQRKHGDALYTRPLVCGVAACSVEGCERLVQARGWCSAHWSRWQRHGSPTARLPGEVVNGRRICPTCSVDKSLAEWTKGECRPCARLRSAAFRIEHPYIEMPRVPAICDRCGDPFAGTKRQSRYCSIECSQADKSRANWKHMNARRARMRAAFVEAFDRAEVFERDGWICGICTEPVNPDTAWPHPMSASLDHIMPISRGGKHSRANAQTAHLTCNVRKSDALPVGRFA